MDVVTQIFRQIGTIFKKMSPMQRTNFFLLSAIIVLALGSLVFWAGQEQYALLYGNLSSHDAAAIKSKLDEQHVPLRVEGTSIYVPSEKVYEIRLQLASEGLPQNEGIGYEIFDKNNFAMTDYMQNLNYKRALEGEMVRTISSLHGIKGARVHLAIPKRELFSDSKEEYTASVVLDVANSGSISKEQIGGIVHLVASSVEGLQPEQVTVIDSRGHLLSGAGEDGSYSGLSAKQLDARKSVESYLEKKAESMLVAILGPGKAIVRVTAQMNFDQVEKTAETYDPDSAVARNETRSEETVKDSAGAPVAAETAAGKSSEKAQEKTVTSYEINRTVERIVSAAGTVKRLSISVVVDGTYKMVEAGEGKEKKMTKEYVPRTEEERKKFEMLVKNAVGFDAPRGDEIVVSDASFDTSFFEQENTELAAVQKKGLILGIVKQVSVAVVFVLAFVFLNSLIKKYSAGLPGGRETGTRYGGPAGGGSQTGGGENEEYAHASSAEAQLRDLAQRDPNRMAELIAEWLSEE